MTRILAIGITFAVLNGTAAFSQGLMIPKAAPMSGEKLFGQQCAACHATVPGETRVGPSLAGVVRRAAGKLPGFSYSPALRRSNITWTPANLDLWLTDSNARMPGSVMNYRQADAGKRAAIIAYLTTLPPR